VSQIEAGRRRPSPEALEFFAGRLGVSTGYLTTGVPDDVDLTVRYTLEEAHRHVRESRPDEARACAEQVIAEAERYDLGRIKGQAYIVLGDALKQQGLVRDAVDAYEHALDAGLPPHEEGLAVGGLGRAYLMAGDLNYAAETVEGYLARAAEGPTEAGVLTDLHSVLVSIYFERGDVLRAEQAARRALAAAGDAETPISVQAVAYWHASRVFAENKQWDEALSYATRARVLMEAADDRRRAARLHAAYAFICLEAEPPKTEEAHEHLDLADAGLREAATPMDRAQILTERSRLALLEERPHEALAFAEWALEVVHPDQLEVARSLFLKGRALALLHRGSEARAAFEQAASTFRNRGARQQEANCWREIGEQDLADGNVGAALDALRAGLEALDPRRSRA
jgi:tetratricopeptide (TPR) repeat protein